MRRKQFHLKSFIVVLLGLLSVISLSLPVVNAGDSLIFYTIADTFVESDNPSANQGEFGWLMVDFENKSTSEDFRRNSYLLFNLTTLDRNITAINSVTLRLYRSWTFPQTTQVGVHSCSDTQWNETELTWSNAPSFSPEPLDVKALDSDGEGTSYSWDVTDAVKNSQDYLTLVLTVEGGEGIYVTGFFAKEMENYDIPMLVIDYEVIPEFPSWTILPLFLVVTIFVIAFKKRMHFQRGESN